MLILGIETSCDETAASIISAKNGRIRLLSSVVSSQIKLHSKWGGVVPNLAAREHLKNILPVISKSLSKAKIKQKNIDLITITNGPGLIPALLIGTNAAKTIAYLWKKPLVGIHHIEGHIYANFIGNKKSSEIKFPALCLVVSGGHTQLVLMKNHLDYKIVGQTLDDAAGEAFDKVARILKLGYPGGPSIAKRAENYSRQKTNFAIKLPRPMLNSKNLNFSFSGLKTAVLYAVKKQSEILKNKHFLDAISHEFQQAVVEVLIAKTLEAAQKYSPKTIMLAGGVSANQALRHQLGKAIATSQNNIRYIMPDISYSIDNAAMIAAAGFFRWQKMSVLSRKKSLSTWKKLKTNANLEMK